MQVLRLECMRHPKRSKANEMAHEVEKSTAAVQSAARHEDEVHEVGLAQRVPKRASLLVKKGCRESLCACHVLLGDPLHDSSRPQLGMRPTCTGLTQRGS